ncbi:hypothetical protein DIPPA_06082 [Diplonema papillatum]|nr:hypothetical protein DIPPA_06082 [Diplonema papillatum]KAJ9467620.1 hypothetical protein DIPPA_06082 [Diplonema papillatum]
MYQIAPVHPQGLLDGKVPLAGRGSYPAGPTKKKAPIVSASKDGGKPGGVVYATFPVAELPFGSKERRIVDHKVRTAHRRCTPKDLQKVVSYWTDFQVDNLPWRNPGNVVVNGRTGGIAPSTVPTVTKEKEANAVNVRALIVPSLCEDTNKTVLERIEIIAAGEKGRVFAYGGVVVAKSEADRTKALAVMIKEQSGADLSSFMWIRVFELCYAGRPNTVFYTPILSKKHTPVFSPQVTHAKNDSETDTYHVTPLRFALSTLLDYQVHSAVPRDTLELCAAADALDEWGKRDMATRILEILRFRGSETRAKTDLDQVKSEKANTRKRRRDEEEGSRKKVRTSRDDKMKKKWASEDEGKTDEEKRSSMQERQKILKEIRAKDAAEDAVLQKQWSAEDKVMADEESKKKWVQVIEQDQLEAFQYFDRRSEGSITRLKMQNLLLCIGEQLTLAQIDQLLNLPQLPKTQEYLPYRKLCATQKLVDANDGDDEAVEAQDATEANEAEQPTEAENNEQSEMSAV